MARAKRRRTRPLDTCWVCQVVIWDEFRGEHCCGEDCYAKLMKRRRRGGTPPEPEPERPARSEAGTGIVLLADLIEELDRRKRRA